MKKYINPELEVKELLLETAITESNIDFEDTWGPETDDEE